MIHKKHKGPMTMDMSMKPEEMKRMMAERTAQAGMPMKEAAMMKGKGHAIKARKK